MCIDWHRLTWVAAAALMLGCAAAVFGQTAVPGERPGSPDPPFDLGSIPLSAERRTEIERAAREGALDRLQSLLLREYKENRRSAPLLRSLGAVLFRSGRHDYSVIAYERAAAIAPLDDRSRFSLAMAYVILNRGDLAFTQLEALAERNKEAPLYLYWLARLDFDANRFESAIERLQAVLRIDPNFIRAHDRLGLCFEGLGDYKRAEENFHRALTLNRSSADPSPWPALNYGSMLRRLNREDEAEAFLREAVDLDPQLAEAHYQLAAVLERRSELEGALAELRQVTKLNPTSSKAFYALGRVYRRLNRKEEALKALATFSKLKDAERRSTKTSSVTSLESLPATTKQN